MYMYVYAYVYATMMLAYMYVTCTLPQVYENAGYATQGALVTTLPADREAVYNHCSTWYVACVQFLIVW